VTSPADPHADFLATLQSRPSRRRRRKRRPTLRRAITTALSFTLLLLGSAAGIAGLAYAKYNGQIKRVKALNVSDPHIRKAVLQKNAENFLIIGSDSRAGMSKSYGNVDGARSDTTILVHLSSGHTKATVISFPRDSWVSIPDCKGSDGQVIPAHTEMFNSAFSIGGPACTVATVQELTGIAVTHFVQIDFAGFERIVDALGTISMCSPVAVDDPESGLKMHPGTNQLDGKDALAYVRARHNLGDGSDLGRIKRQQKFLGAVLRKAMRGDLLRDPSALTGFLNAVTASITLDEDTSLWDLHRLGSSLGGLNPKRVAFYTAPIANRDYSPPGTGLTGKVLLDDRLGRTLYDAVIQDSAPVKAKTTKHLTHAPKPDGNAGQASCTL